MEDIVVFNRIYNVGQYAEEGDKLIKLTFSVIKQKGMYIYEWTNPNEEALSLLKQQQRRIRTLKPLDAKELAACAREMRNITDDRIREVYPLLEKRLKKEDKAGLVYILNMLNPAMIYSESWSKKSELTESLHKHRDKWYKLNRFKTYKDLFLTLVIALCFTACTPKNYSSLPKYQQRDFHAKQFSNKQLPPPKEWSRWQLGLFTFASVVLLTKAGND